MVSVTVLVPPLEYTIPVGLSAVATEGEAPKPKFQEYDQLLPVLPVFTKSIPTLAHCGAVEVNVAVGVWCMVKLFEALTEHPLCVSVVVSVTVLVPAVAYTTLLGSCKVEVPGVASKPKFQFQLTPVRVPVFLKSTPKPVHCGVVETNDATGVELITMVCVVVCVQFWSEMVSVTVLVPDVV